MVLQARRDALMIEASWKSVREFRSRSGKRRENRASKPSPSINMSFNIDTVLACILEACYAASIRIYNVHTRAPSAPSLPPSLPPSRCLFYKSLTIRASRRRFPASCVLRSRARAACQPHRSCPIR